MDLRAHDAVLWEPLAQGGTEDAQFDFLHVPVMHLIGFVIVGALLMWLSMSPAPAVLVVLAVLIDRQLLKNNHNRPREMWLAFATGSTFADRRAEGGECIDLATRTFWAWP